MALLLQPRGIETIVELKKAVISPRPDDTPESIVRRIVSAYLMGYNLIQLRNKEKRLDSSQRLVVKDFTRKKLVGTEILSDLPQELTLQVLLSYSELSIKDALHRMGVIAASMHRESLTALNTDDTRLAQEIISMDDEVDRFNLYIIRLLKVAVSDIYVLKEIGLRSQRECLGYRLITKSVERMADHAVNIAQNRLELNLSLLNREIFTHLNRLSETALEVFETSLKAVFENDYVLADKVLDKAQEVRGMEVEAIRQIGKYANPEEFPALRLIIESILRTAEYGADIAEVVLNMTVKETLVETESF
jgi:phosphate uptake regulator